MSPGYFSYVLFIEVRIQKIYVRCNALYCIGSRYISMSANVEEQMKEMFL